MKLRTLSAAALLATLALGTLAPTAASAATDLKSNGSVKIIEGGAGGPDTETTDPEEPGTKLPPTDPGSPDENTNPATGSLIIEKTT
ncbi:WxL domain-containing protein, partial [Vagococcus sp. BWB3-3]|nr:WxL domain-containing protein [Vagococcus allomyrinae]